MKRIRQLTATVLSLLCLVALVACKATLAPGGAYAPTDTNGVAIFQPDMAFYTIDAAYDLAYSGVDAALKFERDNRLTLWKVSPQIKHTLDEIRPQAWSANVQYLKVRTGYIANPVPSGLNDLQSILAKMQQITSAAQAALPK